jgi:hypothetical protein
VGAASSGVACGPRDDRDDELVDFYARAGRIPPGPIEEVRFDCEPGARVAARDFDCSIRDPVGSDGQRVPTAAGLRCEVTGVAPVGP